MIRESFDYVDYLDLKRSIDDNSLNSQVWQTMASWLTAEQLNGRTVRILEIGAGIGTMIERLLDAGLLSHCEYTAVELEPGFRDAAMQRLQFWADKHDYQFSSLKHTLWSLVRENKLLSLHWVHGDALQTKQQFGPGTFDLIIGHAVIDLLPVPTAMPDLMSLMSTRGAYYFSLNYAGETLFLPPLTTDQKIFQAYNNDMDKRFPGLDWRPSHTGQLLGSWLTAQGHPVIAAGASDWELQSNPDQPDNLFIANILDTIETALAGMPGLTEWLTTRRHQLRAGMLSFRASNQDYFGMNGKP